ncbi:MAG: 3-dehydroquinate synthase [Candidatus Eremiobacteraeota bacterium]|nr:3-dehydroquinate synthase [Candidatus Eremiobacteraeota bacterium]
MRSGRLCVRNDDLGYPIVIADDVRPAAISWLRGRGGRFVVLCDADPRVGPIARSFTRSKDCLGSFAFELGERNKTLASVEAIHETLLRADADRSTLVLGVGGGVASDLFGFAAATFMRGVPYAHVATTLVAMVDAAIGGKTGVDLPSGKNLAGLFADPIAVFAHVGALQTLPYRRLREGLAETVKAAIIEGDEFFESIETLSPHPFWRWPWIEVIERAVKVKASIVLDDREERGMRELLNLGHTFAHGLESASGYRIAHGAAVALGLRACGILAMRTGRFPESDHLRILGTLALLGMPLRTSLDPAAVFEAMKADKKRREGKLRFVLPRSVGDVEYGVAVSDRSVLAALEQLTESPS